jgi:hypothetical protein
MLMGFLSSVVALAAAAAPADLQRAEELMAKYKYAEARTALTKARAAKGLDRASLLRILELQGIAAGQMRQAAPATAAFKELLVLDPSHKLDSDYAPRVTTPFMEAGQLVAEVGALELKAAPPQTSATRVTGLTVEVPKDGLKLARTVVFHVDDGAGWKTLPATLADGRASVAVDAALVRWWAELVGDNDAQLVLLGSEAAPQAAAPPPPVVLTPTVTPTPDVAPVVTAPASKGSPVRTASYFVLGGAVVSAGVGVIFGLKSSGEYSQLANVQRDTNGTITGLTEVQANATASAAARDGTVANACFIGAGALAVTGALMWWLGAPVAVAPTPGGVAVAGTFP